MIGIDIVSINRIRQVKHLELFLERVLTKSEQVEYTKLPNERRKAEWLAGRFAAKEAIIKATDSSLFMSQIELVRVNQHLIFAYQGKTVYVSLAHERDYAVANALLV